MQGNFEKKVQEKLDELRLTPGAPVWEKIERQIQPEKRRRRGVFWLFIFTALLIAGGWWWLTQKTTDKHSPLAQTEHSVTNPVTEKQQASTVKQESKTSASQPLQKVIRNEKKTGALKNIASFSTQQQIVSKKATVSEKNNLPNDNLAKKESREIAVAERKNSSYDKLLETSNEKNNVARKNPPDSTDAVIIKENPTPSTPQATPKSDSIAQNKTEEPKKEVSPVAVDSSKKKIAAVQKKWSNKILFSAGWSSIASLNASSNFAPSPNNSTGGQVGNGNSNYQPANISKGFAFSIGYVREKELSNRLRISVGVQYAFYSTHQKVGVFKTLDTTVLLQDKALNIGGYYSSVPGSPSGNASGSVTTEIYTNHFHVAELPVTLRYRLSKQWPLQLEAGVSYGRLLNTNALTFDSRSGVYYQSKENNKKNYLNTFFALQYTVLNKREWKLTAGPVIQYNAVPLQRVSSEKQHLLFAGVRTAVEF